MVNRAGGAGGGGGSSGTTCYKEGTRIRTPGGEVAIETIMPGDKITVILDGREVVDTVRWVGRTGIDLSRHARVECAAPIRIRAGAIAEGRPARDLFVSPEHCLVIGGRCVPAKKLVNGGSIVSERDHAPFTYYHLELDNHRILLAENTPAESYLDTGNRDYFDNSDEPRQLFPVMSAHWDSARWETHACAPLATAAEVEASWTQLAGRSAAIGFAIPNIITVEDADVRILADGVVVPPMSTHDSRYVFIVPAGATTVTLKSRFCIPSDKMVSAQRDTRRLGIRVNWIAIRSGEGDAILPPDHPDLQDGWDEVERLGRSIWRWTDGAATIPWETVAEPAVLTVCGTQVDRYPLYDENVRLAA
nr:Hint domain-containing protein [uncultured Rhodopila sp.]